MYILFKQVDDRTLGAIQKYGYWLQYTVGYIPDTHVDIIRYTHLTPTVLEESVAKCWKFTQSVNNQISVRDNSLQNDQLQLVGSTEDAGAKLKYTMTPEEVANTAIFMKAIMRKMIDDVYDSRFIALNADASMLESSTWVQQRVEAEAYSKDNTSQTPILQTLASARGIDISAMVELVLTAISAYDTKVASLFANKQIMEEVVRSCQTIEDCWSVLHTRFGVNMPIPIQQSLNMMDVEARFNV